MSAAEKVEDANSPDSVAVLRDPTLSSYREQLVEYLFLSELLQDAWLRRNQRIDVLRSDVDGAGYDLVACATASCATSS
jgi:hypothetical protein